MSLQYLFDTSSIFSKICNFPLIVHFELYDVYFKYINNAPEQMQIKIRIEDFRPSSVIDNRLSWKALSHQMGYIMLFQSKNIVFMIDNLFCSIIRQFYNFYDSIMIHNLWRLLEINHNLWATNSPIIGLQYIKMYTELTSHSSKLKCFHFSVIYSSFENWWKLFF